MSERKTSKAHKKDRESTVFAVDIKSLTSTEGGGGGGGGKVGKYSADTP